MFDRGAGLSDGGDDVMPVPVPGTQVLDVAGQLAALVSGMLRAPWAAHDHEIPDLVTALDEVARLAVAGIVTLTAQAIDRGDAGRAGHPQLARRAGTRRAVRGCGADRDLSP